tara:strand:- start:1079 stop:1267 length:189 start_codon:yes stop_codon:yes gene_type:complete
MEKTVTHRFKMPSKLVNGPVGIYHGIKSTYITSVHDLENNMAIISQKAETFISKIVAGGRVN